MSKRAYHQRTASNNNREEETSSVVEYEYTGTGDRVPDNVTHVRIHPSVTKIDSFSFYNRRCLEEVVLNDGLREIGSNAFNNCTTLEYISTLPSTVTKIDACAFRHCSKLTEIVLNDGLQKIGKEAFAHCSAMQSITIPSIDEIGGYAFSGCKELREVVLNDGLKKIGEHSFAFTLLERIMIPSTVEEICKLAFRNCSRLQEVALHNEAVQIGVGAFSNCPLLERFKFPRLSTRLDNIIQAGQTDIEAKMGGIAAVEWRDGELGIPTVRREIEIRWGRMESTELDEEKLNKIVRLIRYYEIKEATTLFELALWKVRLGQDDDADDINRDARRIEVPGPVKDVILQFLQ